MDLDLDLNLSQNSGALEAQLIGRERLQWRNEGSKLSPGGSVDLCRRFTSL